MTSLALTLNQTCSNEIEQSYQPSPKMKFNPDKKTLTARIIDLTFALGKGQVNVPMHIGTNVKADQTTLVEKLNYHTTSTSMYMKLPTIADYEDIEELNDLESIENILYQASKKTGW